MKSIRKHVIKPIVVTYILNRSLIGILSDLNERSMFVLLSDKVDYYVFPYFDFSTNFGLKLSRKQIHINILIDE